MKRLLLGIIVMAAYLTQSQAQGISINIEKATFSQALLEQLATEYKKSNPEFQVDFSKNTGTDATVEIANGNETNAIGRFYLLPITNSGNTVLESRKLKKGLDQSDLHDLFFGNNDEVIEEALQKKYPLDIYSLTGSHSLSSKLLAQFLNADPSKIKGKKILGREANLVQVVKARQKAVVAGLPFYIYNKVTHGVESNITVIPVDLDGDGKVSDTERSVIGNLDKLSDYLESSAQIGLPSASLVIKTNNPEARKFADWIATQGQPILHQYGFLKENVLLSAQK